MAFRWAGVGVRKNTIIEWLEWFSDEDLGTRKTMMFQLKLMTVCAIIYFTWMARNRLIFDDVKTRPEDCAFNIIQACKYRMRVKGKFKTGVDNRMRIRLDV